jgi:hypothetical protein
VPASWYPHWQVFSSQRLRGTSRAPVQPIRGLLLRKVVEDRPNLRVRHIAKWETAEQRLYTLLLDLTRHR